MNVRKLLKIFGRKHAVLPGPAGRDLPKKEGELRGRVGRRGPPRFGWATQCAGGPRGEVML